MQQSETEAIFPAYGLPATRANLLEAIRAPRRDRTALRIMYANGHSDRTWPFFKCAIYIRPVEFGDLLLGAVNGFNAVAVVRSFPDYLETDPHLRFGIRLNENYADLDSPISRDEQLLRAQMLEAQGLLPANWHPRAFRGAWRSRADAGLTAEETAILDFNPLLDDWRRQLNPPPDLVTAHRPLRAPYFERLIKVGYPERDPECPKETGPTEGNPQGQSHQLF
ncbi:MAG: hypothetical protein AB7E79_05110 [Rhodospirillaceae bacterium]